MGEKQQHGNAKLKLKPKPHALQADAKQPKQSADRPQQPD
jgi:hypothetical protein